jgi:hypothetical protein
MRTAGKWLLMLYAQGQRLGWITPQQGVPSLPDDLLDQAVSRLQTRAALFEFDRGQRQQNAMLALKMLSETYGLNHPIVIQALRIVLEGLDKRWEALAQELPPPTPQPTPQPGAPDGMPQGLSAMPSPANGNGARPMMAGGMRR